MNVRLLVSVLVLTSLLWLNGCSSISESVTSTVRGYLEDDDVTEKPKELTNFKTTLTVTERWSANVGSDSKKYYVRLQPVIDGDRIYAAGVNGKVSAYDSKTGNLLWQTNTEARLRGGPGIGDGLVLLGSADAELIALDRNTGKEKWRTLASSEILAAPGAADGVAVARSIDGRIFGYESATGKRIWIYDSSVPILTLRGTSSAVIFAGGVIAGLSNGKVVALRLKNGELLWETRIAVPRGRADLERIVDIDADPLVADGVIHVATFQGNIATIALENGRGLWNRKMSSHAGIGADKERLYVTDENSEVWSLERRSGSSFWKNADLRARKLTAPVAVGDYVVVADLEGYVHFLKRSSGAIAARIRVGSSPIVAAPVVSGNMVFISSSSGTLTALQIGG